MSQPLLRGKMNGAIKSKLALLVSLVVGSAISLVQAATSVNEATLTFVPKIVGVGLVIFFLGSWMAQQMLTFMSGLFNSLPELVH